MSWRDKQSEIRVFAVQAREGIEDLLFFAPHRAGGDPELREQRQRARKVRRECLTHIKGIVLQVAEDRDLASVGSDGFDALPVGFCLHAQ